MVIGFEATINKVKSESFINRLFGVVYSRDKMESMYKAGYAEGSTLISSKDSEIVKLKSELSKLVSDNKKLSLEVTAKKELNDELSKIIDSLSSEIKIIKKDNEKLNNDISKKDNFITELEDSCKKVISSKTETLKKDVKSLETVIKELKDKHTIELNKVKKECADSLLKIISKKDKEIEQLSKVSNGYTKKDGKSALSCEQVLDIRSSKESLTDLANKYNVSTDTIRRIIKKQTYKNC